MSYFERAFCCVIVIGTAMVCGGCASQAAKTLGSLPVLMTRSASVPPGVTPESALVLPGECQPLINVYHVNLGGEIVSAASTDNGVYRIVDVTPLMGDFFLGAVKQEEFKLESLVSEPRSDTTTETPVNTSKSESSTQESSSADLRLSDEVEKRLRARRAVIAMKLMEIADLNGAEYWRRFSGLIEYQKAFRAGEKAFLGAGIAATFISPVLGASLTGAGLTTDAVTSSLTAGFDIETYTALRDAVRAEIVGRKAAIRKKLVGRCYLDYPISAVLADVADYAHVYSVRGAVDTMKAAMAEQARAAEGGVNEPKQ